MVDQFANFISCLIVIVGMMFTLVMGYYIGYTDGFNKRTLRS